MHSTQWLHHQTTDALENIAKFSLFQENQHFTNLIPIFKAEINKVVSLTNKDPYKLALEKSRGSFSRMISSFLPSMGLHKIKEW